MTDPKIAYPALTQLARAYYHQDWVDEYDDAAAALDDFLDGEPDSVRTLSDEVDRALAQHPTEDAARRFVLDDLDSGYAVDGDGLTYRGWLASVGDAARSR